MMNTFPAIDPFGSEGLEINLDIDNGVIINASPRKGYVNQFGIFDTSINKKCSIFNKTEGRITSPMIRKNNRLETISINQAIDTIKKATQKTNSEQNATFVSAQHTNEMMYMLQKWSRAALTTNTIGSFSNLSNSTLMNLNKNDNVPMHELLGAKNIYVLASELNIEHPVTHQLLQYIHKELNIQITFITNNKESEWIQFADNLIEVSDYNSFIKAINFHLISTDKAFGIFLHNLAIGYDAYKEQLLRLNYSELLKKAGVTSHTVETFAKVFTAIPETVIILSEKSTNLATFAEVKNLMLLTEKQAKPSAGMMFLKSECNSQGLFDMGVMNGYGPGFRSITGEYEKILKSAWNIDEIKNTSKNMMQMLENNEFSNIFIFGENPIKTNPNYTENIRNADFICAQSIFENETTAIADLVLPMNFGIELGGSYSSSFKMVQNFKPIRPCPFNWNDYNFVSSLHEAYGLPRIDNAMDIFFNAAQFFEIGCCGGGTRHRFVNI